MNKSLLMVHSFVIFCSAAIISGKSMAEPANINQLKKEIIQYHDSGKYLAEYSKVSKQAYDYLVKEVTQHHYQKPAIVFDIDETCLSNYQNILDSNFAQNAKAIQQSILMANGEALPGCKKIYDYAVANDINVFFISGRTQNETEATLKNLDKMGFNHRAGLYLLPDTKDANYQKIESFKTATRKMLAENGYDILLNMGDKPTDLSGGYAKATFKLPNPYY